LYFKFFLAVLHSGCSELIGGFIRSILPFLTALVLPLAVSPPPARAFLNDFRRDIKERLDPGKSYGLYREALEIKAPFVSVCRRIESNVQQSDWEILGSWDLDTPHVCGSRARVYLLRNEDYDRAVLAKGPRHLMFLPIRIGVYQEEGKVIVVFTNPDLLAKVFFADLPFVEQDEMAALANKVKKDLVTFCIKGMEGTILTKQLPPIRNDRDVRFFWSGIADQFDVIRHIPLTGDPAETIRKVCDRLEKGMRINRNGWYPVYRDRIGGRACLMGVTDRHIENLTMHYAGSLRPSSGEGNSCSGLYHLTQFPIEILVYVEEGEIRIGILDQFWRMRFYLWDNPYRTGATFMAKDPNFSGRIYKSLLEIIGYP